MDERPAAMGTVGLVDLADLARSIFSDLYRYFEVVKEAPKHTRELRHELGAICNVLDELISSGTLASIDSETLTTSLLGFRDMLQEMDARVKSQQTEGLGRLKWPFSKRENELYFARLEQYKATFLLSLNIQTA